MAKSSIEKTNVMRLLDQKKVPYTPHTYPHGDDAVDGVTVAQMTGMDPAKVFKTLVARGKSGGFHVFVIPVEKELDLKKAAKASGEKSVEMVHVKELLGLTGYVRGGCSPVGMKKAFPTVFDESTERSDRHGLRRKDRLSGRVRPGRPHRPCPRPDRIHHDGISPAASGYSANTVCTPQPVSCASFAASVSASSNSTKCAAPSRSV